MQIWTNCLLNVLKTSRPWHAKAQSAHKLHGAVIECLNMHKACDPIDWQRLILEYPHSSKDGTMIAYYQNDSKAESGIATTVKPARYLKRYFPELRDDVIRDIVGKHCFTFNISDKLEDIILAAVNGPYSCMSDFSFENHPYRVYNPEYGWAIATRTDINGQIVGRALVNKDKYVRAYSWAGKHIYSRSSDSYLELWLNEEGISHVSGWPSGTKIKKIDEGYKLVAPYLDGSRYNLDAYGDYCKIVTSGEYEANNTSGFADESNVCTCERCNSRMDEDDSTYVEGYGSLCESCMEDFIYIDYRRGIRSSDQYYHVDECIQVNGEYYPRESCEEYDIVQLHDCSYCHIDNAVFAEDNGEYYNTDEIGDVVAWCEDTEDYRADYWQCTTTNKYYSTNIDPVEIDGETYHPDNAPETIE